MTIYGGFSQGTPKGKNNPLTLEQYAQAKGWYYNQAGDDTGGGGGGGGNDGPPAPTDGDSPASVKAEFIMQLEQWGIDPDSDTVQRLLKNGVAAGWSLSEYLWKFKSTKAYDDVFGDKPYWMDEDTFVANKVAHTALGVKQQMSDWNLPMDKELREIAQTAQDKGWTADQINNAIRGTAAYRLRFAGKRYDQSEEQYIADEDEYHSIAAEFGIHLGMGPEGPGGPPRGPEGSAGLSQGWRIKYLMANDVSPAEFRAKADAMVQIRDNPEVFKQFAIELHREGLIKPLSNGAPRPLSPESLLPFIFGQGDAKWHEVWQNTVADYAATDAGIKIVKGRGLYTGLSRQTVHNIADKTSEWSQGEIMQKFQDLSALMVDILPLSQARQYGIDKKDLIQAAFGGKDSAQARKLIERVQAEHEAFSKDRAISGLDQQGRAQQMLDTGQGFSQANG